MSQNAPLPTLDIFKSGTVFRLYGAYIVYWYGVDLQFAHFLK